MQTHILSLTLHPGVEPKVKTFYESNHVAYQIKGNLAQSTMQEHILSVQNPLSPGMGSNIFTEIVTFHIK